MTETITRTPPKRDAILAAAYGEFSANGYHGARIERIATGAGANKQLIFHYFGSKEGLYGAVVINALSTTPMWGSGGLPPEIVRRQVARFATWLHDTPGAATLIVECLSGMGVPAAAVTAVRAWRDALVGSIRGTLEDGQRRGHFRDDLDHAAVAELIIGSVVGLSLAGAGRGGSDAGASSPAGVLGRIIADYCAWR